MRYLKTSLLACLMALANPLAAQATCGSATFYHDWYESRIMANGQRFYQSSNSAASNNFPLGTRLRVYYRGRSTTVVIRDRTGGVFLDLSRSSFGNLAPHSKGIIRVCVSR